MDILVCLHQTIKCYNGASKYDLKGVMVNSFKILLALISSVIVGCSSFENNYYAKNLDPNKVLPNYASPNRESMDTNAAIFVRQLDNQDLLTSNNAPEFDLNESNIAPQWQIRDNNQVRKALSLPILDVNYQNNDLNYYPLLDSNLQMPFPARMIPTPPDPEFSYLDMALTLNPSNYNLRTLQMDNVQQALLNAAFLDAHKVVASQIDPDVVKLRGEYLEVAKISLETMYSNDASLRAKFESSTAFGVFEVKNFNALLYVAAYGRGVIFDNKNRHVIYMNTVRSGTGPGIGYESMYIVFVFKNELALSQFVGAKGGGADVGASATLGVFGEQISLNPEISVYQLYKNGFDLQANWGGTIYFPAPSLND